MIKLTLIAIWIILIAILFLSVNFYVLGNVFHRDRRAKKTKPTVVADIAIAEMERTVKDKNSATEALRGVIEALIAHHTIEPKTDGKTSKEAKRLLDIIFTMAGHKNMPTELRSDMLRRFSEKNPSYSSDFERALSKR